MSYITGDVQIVNTFLQFFIKAGADEKKNDACFYVYHVLFLHFSFIYNMRFYIDHFRCAII